MGILLIRHRGIHTILMHEELTQLDSSGGCGPISGDLADLI